MLQYYSNGADVLNEPPTTLLDRSKDGFSGQDDDENGHYIRWLIDGPFDDLVRDAIVLELHRWSISLREFCVT